MQGRGVEESRGGQGGIAVGMSQHQFYARHRGWGASHPYCLLSADFQERKALLGR